LLVANLEHEMARTHRVRMSDAGSTEIAAVFAELEGLCRKQGEQDWMEGVKIEVRRTAEMRYAGQSYELEVPFAAEPVDGGSMAEAVWSFHRAHERIYGHRDADDLVELVTLRVTLAQTPPRLWRPAVSDEGEPDPTPALKGRRPAYFAEAGGYVDTPVYARDKLVHGMRLTGPAIVEQEDCTTVVYPGDEASVDRYGNILIEVRPPAA
jgi:N-methylhydantoinase A